MPNPADPSDRRALLQNALQALDEMQAKLNRVERARTEPIAVVGMGCRFPGGVDSPESYWQLLHDGVDAIREYPEERRAMAIASGIDLDAEAARAAWYGGFLDHLDQFDPQFFGISPREATTMDPQQRLVLEVAWEALERAGIAPDRLSGSSTGVFVGITTNDYLQLVKLGGPTELDVYAATGGALNAAAGRVAYTLGLQGPTMAVDTACSSSLVAIHLACQSLRNGECDMALAGGVNVVLMAEAFICFNRWGMMAPDGRCKAFDSSADGFVRAEGCGIVVLKRLSDALAAGDNILAVVRGSAVNQDGRSSGLTVPNGPAQQAVLRKALAAAKVEPAQVQYVEAHGTGTTLGDPIEVEAIGAMLGKGRRADQPLFLSSVKTNIGHLESAAGIAGFIKVVLAMQHGQLPPHLHFQERSARIPWPDFPIVVPTELTPWPAQNGKRIAGVSGFGFSGTNAHVVLESAPAREPAAAAIPAANMLTLSAKNETALRALAGRFAAQLAAQLELALADICKTSNVGRAHFNHRLAVNATSTEQLQAKLAAFAAGQDDAGCIYNRASRPRIAFLFTGQGAQYPGMAAQLDVTQPVFRAALDRCAAILQPLLDRPLREILFATDPALGAAHPLHQTAYTQPALFAIEYALAELWRAWGVTPQALLGHSVGEYVAAVLAGVFSLEDGLKLIAARGRLMQALPAGGAMTAIFAPAAQVQVAVAPHAAQVAIAAVNGPEHTVISGVAAAVQQVADAFAATGVRVQALTVSHAFHSPLMLPMLAEFRRVAAGVTYHTPQLPLFSNVTGREIDAEVTTSEYWVRHILAPVQFAPAIEALHSAGFDTFVEIGPHPVLSAMGQACLPDLAGTWASSLRRNRDERTHMLESLAKLYVAGVAIDWDAFHHDDHGARLALPTYPFQRQRYWVEPVKPRAIASYAPATDSAIHPLLGCMTRSPAIRETLFETTIGAQQPAYLTDHRLYGTAIFPGAGYLEMALAAAQAADLAGVPELSLTIREPLVLPETGQRALQLVLAPNDGGQTTVQILSRDGAKATAFKREIWSTHATGTLQTTAEPTPATIDLSALAAQHPEALDIAAYYQQLADIGLNYGPAFCGISEARWRTGSVLGRIRLTETIDLTHYRIHPALLDACFQLVGAVLPKTDDSGAEASIYVPVEIEGLRLYGSAAGEVWCHVEVQPDAVAGKPTLDATLRIFDNHGHVLAQIAHLHLRRTDRRALERASDTLPSDWLYEVAWRQVTAPTTPAASTGAWLIYADAHGLGAALAERLRALGATSIVVTPGASTARLTPNSWQLDPTDPDAPARLLREAFADESPRGAIHLWSLSTASALAKGDLAELHAQQTLGIASALHLTQALAAQPNNSTRLWLVTRGAQSVSGEPAAAQAAALWGFGRVVATEQEQLGSVLLDLDPFASDGELDQLLAEIAAPDREREIAWRAGIRHAARLLRLEAKPALLPSDQPYELALPSRGTLDALTLRPLARRAPGAGEIELAVRATGLNFRDVLNVLGMYPGDPGPPGLECAGIVTALGAGVTKHQIGDAVVALAPRSFDSYVLTRAALAVPKPDRLSFAEAVTIPSAFLTAAYGLQHLAQLQPGERVLIHAAAGGVGLAAVQLALRVGAEVFATAGSPEKHAFLRAIGVQHIFSSRTLDFADAVLLASAGRGVDVVLNSLADEFITRSLDILAPGGRFLEIGKRGIWTDDAVAASYPHIRYLPYDLGAILEQQPGLLEDMLRDLLLQFGTGELQPLPLRAFSANAIVDAFRFMAQARHIGKVVVTHRPSQPAIHADATYLITGGLGGLGLVVAHDLVARGARHLALIGRRAPADATAAGLAALEQQGVDVRVFAADIASADELTQVLATIAATQPALRGIIHAAGVLDDGALAQQSWSRFQRVLAPKVDGAWLLDQQTHGMALDFFVLFSSASALLGAAGQSNYAAANATLDALAQQRRAAGKPALSINWGAWNTVGMAAGLDAQAQQRMAARGVGSIAPEVGVRVLARLLEGDAAQVAVLPLDWSMLLAQFPAGAEPPLLTALAQAIAPPATHTARAQVASLADLLAQTVAHERRDLLMKHIQAQLIKVLALDPSQPLDPFQGLTDIGMDSLMAVELSNRLRVTTALALPSTLAFEYPTLDALTDYLAAELLGSPVDAPVLAVVLEDAQAAADLIELAQLSEEEAEDILLRELAETGY